MVHLSKAITSFVMLVGIAHANGEARKLREPSLRVSDNKFPDSSITKVGPDNSTAELTVNGTVVGVNGTTVVGVNGTQTSVKTNSTTVGVGKNGTTVQTPTTNVSVNADSGVTVEAPGTSVKVNDKGVSVNGININFGRALQEEEAAAPVEEAPVEEEPAEPVPRPIKPGPKPKTPPKTAPKPPVKKQAGGEDGEALEDEEPVAKAPVVKKPPKKVTQPADDEEDIPKKVSNGRSPTSRGAPGGRSGGGKSQNNFDGDEDTPAKKAPRPTVTNDSKDHRKHEDKFSDPSGRAIKINVPAP